ncbi:MAG TPA: isoprenylcysteine carboxylmethyltransferase family protein [Pseudolabrys sp.]|nr:isoprenylcysteine carboxylmethyltransferase family protein [Pseudolabrys sp.]
MIEAKDTANVVAPPPLLALAAVVLGLLLDHVAPAYLLDVLLSWGTRILLGLELIVAGLALAVAALRGFRSVGTNPEPWKPSTALFSTGVFAWLRNPMYVGGTAALIGLALLLASDWMVVTTVILALVLHFGVVLREERYLEAKFGDAYRQYKARVPRYGIPT